MSQIRWRDSFYVTLVGSGLILRNNGTVLQSVLLFLSKIFTDYLTSYTRSILSYMFPTANSEVRDVLIYTFVNDNIVATFFSLTSYMLQRNNFFRSYIIGLTSSQVGKAISNLVDKDFYQSYKSTDNNERTEGG